MIWEPTPSPSGVIAISAPSWKKCHADDQHERSDQKQGNGSGLHRYDKNAEQQHNDGDGEERRLQIRRISLLIFCSK